MATKRLVEVTVTVKAVLMVGQYANAYQLAEKHKLEMLAELGKEASIYFDDFNAKDWPDDFIPYGDNANEMPLSSYLLFGEPDRQLELAQ